MILVDGVCTSSQKMLSAVVKKKKWIKCQQKKNMVVESTCSVTVIPRLCYLSALTSLLEMASCFFQGFVEERGHKTEVACGLSVGQVSSYIF